MDRAGFQPPLWISTAVIFLVLLFPFSLAYAIVKLRAMEISVLLKRSARCVLTFLAAEAPGPGPRNHQGHQQQAQNRNILLELDHLAHPGLRILYGPKIVHHETSGHQKNQQHKDADRGMKAEQHARSPKQEQGSADADGDWRCRDAFHFGVTSHHVEASKVVDAGHEEKCADQNPSEQKRDVENGAHGSSFCAIEFGPKCSIKLNGVPTLEL
jgi:hypothetical protein